MTLNNVRLQYTKRRLVTATTPVHVIGASYNQYARQSKLTLFNHTNLNAIYVRAYKLTTSIPLDNCNSVLYGATC